MSILLNNLFQHLQFPAKSHEENGFEGIVFSKDYDSEFAKETADLLTNKIKPDAVYYAITKLEKDAQGNILPEYKEPQILFYDFSQETDNIEKNKKIEAAHKAAWNYDKPLCFMYFSATDLRIYNAFSYSEKTKTTKKIEITTEVETTELETIYKKFSFWALQSSKVWEDLATSEESENKAEKNKTIFKKRVTDILLQNIQTLYQKLIGETLKKEEKPIEKPLQPIFANKLLLRLIFIRYLIDRDVNFKNTDLFEHCATPAQKQAKLYEIIANKVSLQALFKYFHTHFEGNLFDTTKDEDLDEEIHLHTLRNIFEGKVAKNEYYQWNIFDFAIIPIETISGIYENILESSIKKKDAAVYTPPFVADYILDNLVKKHIAKTKSCKILDPACGSGIFLVQTYRRIVQERLKAENLDINTLIKIAEENLYGIDKNGEALNVALFSVYIAILDFLKPFEIENGVKLPDLIGKNLFCNNFFNTNDANKPLEIWVEKRQEVVKQETHEYNEILRRKDLVLDFIVGNPPWIVNSNSKDNKNIDKEHQQYLKDNTSYKKISDNISQSFVLRAKDFAKPDHTQICFIVTSKAFYNLGADGFKKYVFENFIVSHITDFSVVRRLLFSGADNPALALSYSIPSDKSLVTNNVVNYLGIKNNIFISKFRKLVINAADIKKIKQSLFVEEMLSLKILLYGNFIDFEYVNFVKSNSILLENFLKSKGINYGDGIKGLTVAAEKEIREKAAKRKDKSLTKAEIITLTPYDEIRNIPIIETDAIKPFYSHPDMSNLPKIRISEKNKNLPEKDRLVNDLILKSGRNINLYRGCKVIFRRPKDVTYIMATYIEVDAVYRTKVYGIAVTEGNEATLKELYGIFISNFFGYYQFLTSSSWGIYKPEIYGDEYFSFPYKSIVNKTIFVDLVNLFIERCKEWYKHNTNESELLKEVQTWEEYQQINNIVNATYQITEKEQDSMAYILDIARYEFQGEAKIAANITRQPTREELKKYAQVFVDYYGKVYNGENWYFQVQIYEFEYFVTMKFNLLDQNPQEVIRFETNNNNVFHEQQLFEILANHLTLDYYELSNTIFIQKDVKGFEKDFFYIIKPKQIKSWHKAIANQDVLSFRKLMRNSQKVKSYA
jgi:hypothetical protein